MHFITTRRPINVDSPPNESACIITAEGTGEGLVGTNICCITVCVTANSSPRLTLGECCLLSETASQAFNSLRLSCSPFKYEKPHQLPCGRWDKMSTAVEQPEPCLNQWTGSDLSGREVEVHRGWTLPSAAQKNKCTLHQAIFSPPGFRTSPKRSVRSYFSSEKEIFFLLLLSELIVFA